LKSSGYVKMGSTLAKFNDPCVDHLNAYIRCAEKHAGKRPDVYEEYCEEEKSLFLDCRAKQRAERSGES